MTPFCNGLKKIKKDLSLVNYIFTHLYNQTVLFRWQFENSYYERCMRKQIFHKKCVKCCPNWLKEERTVFKLSNTIVMIFQFLERDSLPKFFGTNYDNAAKGFHLYWGEEIFVKENKNNIYTPVNYQKFRLDIKVF